MILPLLAFFFKPLACSISDAKGCHREVLIAALSAFALSYGSLGIIPFIKDRNNRDTDFICWVIISIIMSIGYVSVACIFCMNDALASNYARKHNKFYSRMRIFACVGWSAGAFLLMVVGEVSWLPFQVFGCIILVITSLLDIAILLLWPYKEDFEMFHDGSTVEQRKLSIVGPNTMALMANIRHRGSISRDMIERIKEGRSKSVGYLPKVQTLNLSVTDGEKLDTFGRNNNNHDFSNNKQQIEQKEYSNFQCQITLIKLIASSHKSFLRYIVLFTTFGLIQGIIWTYQLDYFRAKVTPNEDDFKFISTLCMIAQSWCGEIPINIFAMDLLRIFGSNANLSLALVSIGLRCFFYSNILPYLGSYSVILAEALQGPSLALYWVLTVDIGSNYALMVTDFMPEMRRLGMIRDKQHEEELSGCSRATMIGIMSSSMEGLGVATGAFLGGIISTKLGYETMWNICATIGFIAGFGNIGWDLTRKLFLNRNKEKQNNNIPTVIIQDTKPIDMKGTKL